MLGRPKPRVAPSVEPEGPSDDSDDTLVITEPAGAEETGHRAAVVPHDGSKPRQSKRGKKKERSTSSSSSRRKFDPVRTNEDEEERQERHRQPVAASDFLCVCLHTAPFRTGTVFGGLLASLQGPQTRAHTIGPRPRAPGPQSRLCIARSELANTPIARPGRGCVSRRSA